MSGRPFAPTAEQARVIEHDRSAFVSACPGAGKTRVLVERARVLLKARVPGKGIAFLSFTNTAMSELEQRLQQEGLLPSPAFPHYIGTFDSFLWHFVVLPFGIPGCESPPRLVPDKNERTVGPFPSARRLPLECFDRVTGKVVREVARRLAFDPTANPSLTKAYMTIAASTRSRFLQRGELDFEDTRAIAAERLGDHSLSRRLAGALAGRFREVIVDEAHDCNPADLRIIGWLRDAGIATKVICDPQQSIYEFRGGVTDELRAFGRTFEEGDVLSMSGNFRSSDSICKAIVALRPVEARGRPDQALGEFASIDTPIQILAYSGNGVPAVVGERFHELVMTEGMDVALCPVLASTWNSAAKAVGQPTRAKTRDVALRLANAVASFHLAAESGSRNAALDEVHGVILDIEGRLGVKTYHQYLVAEGVEPGVWRPRIVELIRELRYDAEEDQGPEAWHARAKALLATHLSVTDKFVSRRVRWSKGLGEALCGLRASGPTAKSIHSVKGKQFPAVCVVMTTKTAGGILDYLETGAPAARSEDARRVYVAASRAQRLLAIAAPKTQAERMEALLATTGAPVEVVSL